MCKPNSWCSMIAFFGLSSVLCRPIKSLFPNTGSEFMNRIYNRLILPRQDEYFNLHCIIMWSSTSATNFQNSGQANHFVPVFKRKEYDYSSLLKTQFLNKNDETSLFINSSESSFLQNNYIDLTVDNTESINNECTTNTEYITDTIIANQKNQDAQDKTLIGLLMEINNAYIPSINNIDGYLIYPEAKDFQLEISRQKALNFLFIYNVNENQDFNYHWRPWQISNYCLFDGIT